MPSMKQVTEVRESDVIFGAWKSDGRFDIRDVTWRSRCNALSYVHTGAVSRTPVNCAPLSLLSPQQTG
jgi:hypothetical protein